MTKFEEEFKALTSWYWLNVDLVQQILTRFGNWHSDEEFQKLLDKYSNLNYNYKKEVIRSYKLESQIIGLKSQLQQQALPVVPECVAEFIEDCKKEGDCLFGVFADATRVEHDMPDLVYFWLGDEGNNDELFARAWLDGYTVEKPQLFYLREKNTNYYLNKSKNNGLELVPNPYFDEDNQFTKQEIDSMQTGSYELVPVEDGE